MIPVAFEMESDAVEAELEARVGPVGKWVQARDAQLKELSDLGLRPDMTLVDLGCGPLRAGLQLIDYLDTGRYVGIDIDAGSIEAGKALVRRFDLDGKQARLIHSETFGRIELERSGFADRIWCYQVMIHMPRDVALDCIAQIGRMLKPGGKAWVTARVQEEGDSFDVTGKWRDFPISEAGRGFFETAAEAVGMSYDTLPFGDPRSFNKSGKIAWKTLIEFTKL